MHQVGFRPDQKKKPDLNEDLTGEMAEINSEF